MELAVIILVVSFFGLGGLVLSVCELVVVVFDVLQ